MGIVVVCFLCNLSFTTLFSKMLMSILLSVLMYGAILVLFKNQVALEFISGIKDKLTKKYLK